MEHYITRFGIQRLSKEDGEDITENLDPKFKIAMDILAQFTGSQCWFDCLLYKVEDKEGKIFVFENRRKLEAYATNFTAKSEFLVPSFISIVLTFNLMLIELYTSG